MIRIYKERLLNAIMTYSKARLFPVISPNRAHSTYEGLYNAFAILRYRANILLKFLYPNGIIDYFDRDAKFQYTMYVKERDLYIDFFGEIEHRGPMEAERSFNPLNIEDTSFIQKAQKYANEKSEMYWMAVAKAVTWGGYDYRKLRYMKFNKLNYKIYWNISQIESLLPVTAIRASHRMVNEYNKAIQLQNLVYKDVDELFKNSSNKVGIVNMLDIL